jgi:hypothetical protein
MILFQVLTVVPAFILAGLMEFYDKIVARSPDLSKRVSKSFGSCEL